MHSSIQSNLIWSIYSAIYLITYISIYPSIYVYLCLSMSIYVYLCLSMSIYVYLCLSMSIYVYLCLSMSIYVYLCLSICLSIYLSIYSIYLSIYLSILVIWCYTYLSTASPNRQATAWCRRLLDGQRRSQLSGDLQDLEDARRDAGTTWLCPSEMAKDGKRCVNSRGKRKPASRLHLGCGCAKDSSSTQKMPSRWTTSGYNFGKKRW